MYTVTNKRKGETMTGVSEDDLAALFLEVAGGGYTTLQTATAMQYLEQVRVWGRLEVSTLVITKDLQPGDRVRSYDFPHTDAFYVEGVIMDRATPEHLDGDRYVIAVSAWIVEGKSAANYTDFVYPVKSDRVALITKEEGQS